MARSGGQPQNQHMVVQKGHMKPAVVAYALDRLADLGIGHGLGLFVFWTGGGMELFT